MRRLAAIFALLIAVAACNRTETDEHAGHQTAPPDTRTPAAHDSTENRDDWTARGREVTFGAADGEAPGYLSEPEVSAPDAPRRAGLIVIHEWWGIDDWIRQNADRFAQQGYVVLAPDLYRGRSTDDPGEAHELMRGLPEDRAIADLKGAWAHLAARPDVDPGRIGVVGWCMGGGYALALAAEEPRLGAANINYGRLIEDRQKLGGIRAPVLGIFGAEDRGIPVESVRRFERSMKELDKDVSIHIYEGAGHAFMNPGNEDGYVEAASRDAWSKIDAFLARTLAPGS